MRQAFDFYFDYCAVCITRRLSLSLSFGPSLFAELFCSIVRRLHLAHITVVATFAHDAILPCLTIPPLLFENVQLWMFLSKMHKSAVYSRSSLESYISSIVFTRNPGS